MSRLLHISASCRATRSSTSNGHHSSNVAIERYWLTHSRPRVGSSHVPSWSTTPRFIHFQYSPLLQKAELTGCCDRKNDPHQHRQLAKLQIGQRSIRSSSLAQVRTTSSTEPDHEQAPFDNQAYSPSISIDQNDHTPFQSNFDATFNSSLYPSSSHVRKIASTPEQDPQQGFVRLYPTPPIEEIWSIRPKTSKVDLSHWHPLVGERNSLEVRPEQYVKDELAFRANRGRRKMVKVFTEAFYSHVNSSEGIADVAGLQLLRHPLYKSVPSEAIDHADLLAWSWILSNHSRIAIRRLVALSESRTQEELPPVPVWIIMQILRAEHIDPESLTSLVDFMLTRLSQWDWRRGDTAMLLVVRLWRHARISAPSAFESVAKCFLDLLDLRFPQCTAANDLPILSHWCNRMLTLMALPSSLHPFKSMKAQQVAQLALAEYMQEREPTIAMNREGFEAVAKLQLMHAKTREETDWARAKAPTWPPWAKQHQMGAAARQQSYPGQATRVIKVLRRMEEAGYRLFDSDHAIKVLTGWDTDGSPTIQVRRRSNIIRTTTRSRPSVGRDNIPQPHLIWTARLEATRSVREAWMCFCSYEQMTKGQVQASEVYHAMFGKLFAKEIIMDDDHGPVPGDGLEIFPDPELPRDRVYIPQEIPTFKELLAKMVENNVQISAHLLADLLEHEPHLKQGIRYIEQSSIEENLKTALVNYEALSLTEISERLRKMPQDLIRAYVGMVAGPHVLKTEPYTKFTSQRLLGPYFAFALLHHAQIEESSIWNAFYTALRRHVHPGRELYRRCHPRYVWDLTLFSLKRNQLTPRQDFGTFSQIAQIAWQVQSGEHADPDLVEKEPMHVAKQLFMTAADGHYRRSARDWPDFCDMKKCESKVLNSIPSYHEIDWMIWLLGAQQRDTCVADILLLLQWIIKHQEQIVEAGHAFTRNSLALVRIFTEGLWADKQLLQSDKVRLADEQQLGDAKQLMEKLGAWPNDRHVYGTMAVLHSRVDRLRRMVKRDLIRQS